MARLVADAKRRRYTLVNEDGETWFRQKAAQTGSHLVTKTTCLMERQMDDLQRQTQQKLQTTQMQVPPPQGE